MRFYFSNDNEASSRLHKNLGRLLLVLMVFAAIPVSAQKRNINLIISVTANTGENLDGQFVALTQTDYSLDYGSVTLDSTGSTTVKVYPGNHHLSIDRDGFDTAEKDFVINSDTTVTLTLQESFLTPFSLSAQTVHNPHTGLNDVTLTWNREKPVFYDDFDAYEPFATSFGEWTGIDRDHLTAAPLVGSYPNRGVLQYAQIINPMTVDPAWWYDYPVLRPYSGLQYVGFTRTNSGDANDDWLISPVITPGNHNVLQFLAKAADQFSEKFQVYITTKTGNPDVADFKMISSGNFESVDYTGWHVMQYDLSDYAGKPIKFAIRYIGHSNNGGSFMLMVDNVYVGQPEVDDNGAKADVRFATDNILKAKASRLPSETGTPQTGTKRSPLNPNESFILYKNGTQAGTTDNYSYTFTDLPAGTYTLGVQSTYKTATSEIIDTVITIAGEYANAKFVITTNNNLNPDGAVLTLTNKATSATITDTLSPTSDEAHPTPNSLAYASLPYGTYFVSVKAPHYNDYEGEITIDKDGDFTISLSETIIDPYNITADVTSDGDTYKATVKWNQNTSFYDSFESYPDFASGSFGDWRSYDLDQHVCYPISFNGSIVNFPGASTQQNPSAVTPLVFNPNSTIPAMSSDYAVLAPEGDKTVIFFSPQQNGANKWLVSPLQTIRDNYVVRFAAKAYTDAYGSENFEVAVSTEGNDPQTASFTNVSTINGITAGEWTVYETDLSEYAGQQIYIGLHYTCYDCFFSQVDNFFVGNPDASGTVDVGPVLYYNIYVDGVLVGTSTTPTYDVTGLDDGPHTIGVEAVYASGNSEIVNYALNITNGITHVDMQQTDIFDANDTTVYTLSGAKVCNGHNATANLPRGIYIQVDKQGNRRKVTVK